MNTRLSQFLLLIVCTFYLSTLLGQTNQYLHFDREDDFVELKNGSQLLNNATAISMTGWFYTDELIYGSGMIGIRDGGTGSSMYLIQLSNGQLECRYIASNGLFQVQAAAGTIQQGVWQHVAWIYDGASVELFIDGISRGVAPASGTFSGVDKPITIGRLITPGYNFYFKGRADEVSVWTKALSQAEIQDMMTNELVGNEPNLELYYKFDQGYPGGDNTGINKLSSLTGNGQNDADLRNFALTGTTSNFSGSMEPGMQAISAPLLSNKLTTDDPFMLNSTSTSGLPVSYTVVSGPASVSGNLVTLTGIPGEVFVKADQEGDSNYQAANSETTSFMVLDATVQFPNIEIRNPVSGTLANPGLDPIHLAAIIDIDFPDLFSIENVSFSINGNTVIPVTDWSNLHYTTWWTPPAAGSYTLEVSASNNHGGSLKTETVNFVVDDALPNASNVTAFWNILLDQNDNEKEMEAELPSYTGAFNNINATMTVTCPPGGCDPWDRLASIEVKGHNGEWYKIIRYITSYGVPCNHQIDLTDFMSLLQGKVTFRGIGGAADGFVYGLNLSYTPGVPVNKFSTVTKLWNDTYPFGDMANLQPCESYSINFDTSAVAAKIKLVSTGHGWGDNNTGNAAEFHEDTHSIFVNNVKTFDQHNWQICNPNPDGCSPQNGTWYYARAGWCPGSIAQFFDFNMTPYVNQSGVDLSYVFDPDYVDLCHPNNPNCTSNVTCPNCNDGFNPHLVVQSFLISYSNTPIVNNPLTSVESMVPPTSFNHSIFPNPSNGLFKIQFSESVTNTNLSIYDTTGRLVKQISKSSITENTISINLANFNSGVYLLKGTTNKGSFSDKIIINQ